MKYFAGVELGGTTCVAAVSSSDSPTNILQRKEFKTGKPLETLNAIIKYLSNILDKLIQGGKYEGIGIASFGPVDLNTSSPSYGFITSTPKQSWRYTDIVGPFRRVFGDGTPVLFDTDVNAPAYGEATHSHLLNVAYVTVGTGVGVGVHVNGAPIHGLLHPEAGHMIVGQKPGDSYPGCCVFHKNCVEGMVNSTALAQRTGVQASELSTLPDSHEVWELVGYYLGAMCVNLTFVLSPDVIVFGGGIMKRKVIYKHCRETFQQLIAGYLDVNMFKTNEGLEKYIRPSTFGNNAGIMGALLLAQIAK